jgi:hypothetical protein
MKDLLLALQQFHLECKPVVKDSNNPFFKSKYATLDSIQEHIRPILQKCGLVVSQPTEINEVAGTFVRTTVYHVASGESISSVFPVVTTKATAQEYGSAVSYAKRYSLSGLLNITIQDEDDDGNAASVSVPKQNVTPEKRWLVESDASWDKVVDAINKKTATIDDVRKKFNVSKAIEAKLLKLIP